MNAAKQHAIDVFKNIIIPSYKAKAKQAKMFQDKIKYANYYDDGMEILRKRKW